MVEELEELSSPISQFVRECCLVEVGRRAEVDALFQRWQWWCEKNGKQPGSKQTFGRDLLAAVPGLKRVRPKEDGHRYRGYEGLELLPPIPA